MNHARSFILMAAVFLLFIGACTYAAGVVRAIDDGTRLAYEFNRENDRKVKTILSASREESYTGAQVVNMIRNAKGEGTDIEVNGVLYSRYSDYENMNPGVVDLSRTYRANYDRDASGRVTKIVFRS